jgi:hypothetical protein
VRAFRLHHTLHIRRQFSGFSCISNTLLSLRFSILLLLRWTLLAFPMLILQVVGLTERAPLGLFIFLDLLSFAGLLENSLQLHSPPLRQFGYGYPTRRVRVCGRFFIRGWHPYPTRTEMGMGRVFFSTRRVPDTLLPL